MKKFKRDFQYDRAFDIITLAVLIIFVAFFAQSMITVMGAFESEVYSNTIAELSRMGN